MGVQSEPGDSGLSAADGEHGRWLGSASPVGRVRTHVCLWGSRPSLPSRCGGRTQDLPALSRSPAGHVGHGVVRAEGVRAAALRGFQVTVRPPRGACPHVRLAHAQPGALELRPRPQAPVRPGFGDWVPVTVTSREGSLCGAGGEGGVHSLCPPDEDVNKQDLCLIFGPRSLLVHQLSKASFCSDEAVLKQRLRPSH